MTVTTVADAPGVPGSAVAVVAAAIAFSVCRSRSEVNCTSG
jgi:hypothetical protein